MNLANFSNHAAVFSRCRAVDAHNHVWLGPDGKLDLGYMNNVLANADFYGIERLVISCPDTATPSVSEAVFRRGNDAVLEALRLHPDRFIGFCFVDPGEPGAMEEIDRCIAGGMRGIKLYHQHRICDEIQRPLMERAAQYGVPVLMHAGKCNDTESQKAQPGLSHAGHFRCALEMFPKTTLIQAHIGGGGDWEWNLRELDGLRNPHFYIDLGGSICDAAIVRRTIEAVGIDHVLFATDMSFPEAVARILCAGLSEIELQKILHDNWVRIEEEGK